jgi:hypothetical protein
MRHPISIADVAAFWHQAERTDKPARAAADPGGYGMGFFVTFDNHCHFSRPKETLQSLVVAPCIKECFNMNDAC